MNGLHPFALLAFNIKQRHDLLTNTIGYFPEEAQAYKNVFICIFGSLSYILLSSGLATLFFKWYNNKYHPFHKILVDGESKDQGLYYIEALNLYVLQTVVYL